MPARLRVLFVGNHAAEEFQPAYESLRPLTHVETAANIETAARLFQKGFAADVIVLAQERPGEWSEQAVSTLRRAAPIAPLIALMGSWCAAAARHGETWPGAIHVTWDRWESGILPGFQQLLAGACPWWAWPFAEDDERLLRARPPAANAGAGVVAVSGNDHESEAWLADVCRAGGYDVLLLDRRQIENIAQASTPTAIRGSIRGLTPPARSLVPPARPLARGVMAILWEIGEVESGDGKPWECAAQALDDAPVLLLMNFPRHCAPRHGDLGAAAILRKPFGVTELLEQLAAVCRS